MESGIEQAGVSSATTALVRLHAVATMTALVLLMWGAATAAWLFA